MAYSNEPLTREHIDSPICLQEEGSKGIAPIPLIVNNSDVVYKDDTTYRVGTHTFNLNGASFTCDGLSITLPTHQTITPIERLSLALGYALRNGDTEYDIDASVTSFPEILHSLTMMALKDLNLISGQFTQHKQLNYGKHIFEAYLMAVTGKGTIPSSNKHIRWLNEQDTLQLKAKFFTTSNYQAGVRSMEYTPTDIAERVMRKVFEFLDTIIFKRNDIVLQPLDFKVTREQLHQIRLRDAMLLLKYCIGYNDGFIIRPEIIDRQKSRVYSVFTSISSKTRTLLGFINYDIGSALQTICLQLVDNPSLYPLHQELMNDKQAFRAKIMQETGKSLTDVKEELSKADNLDKVPKRYTNYPTLKAYCEESLILRKDVIDNAHEEVHSIAYSHAKLKWISLWHPNKKDPELIPDGKKESSIFFFIWTQYEREIREAMMSCFTAPECCHQVHDAVYSTEVIDAEVIEAKVLEETGFVVKISN